MNKTYKVVFNKVRGTLLVANETTSSVQKKGTKTVLAVATALAMGSVMAQGYETDDVCADGTCTYSGVQAGTEWQSPQLNGEHSAFTGGQQNVSAVVISDSTFDKTSSGFFLFSGTQKIEISNTSFSQSKETALFFRGHNKASNNSPDIDASSFSPSSVTLSNVDFTNNTASDSGAAMYLYGNTDFTMTGGSFRGNSITSDGDSQYYGGAVVVKSGNVVFENVDFDNNVITAENGFATGGAILVDKTTGIKVNGTDLVGDVTFKITENGLIYSGNNVIGSPESYAETFVDTYGWYATTSGGFLFLDRSSWGTFDIADSVTLTIGEADADYENNPELDSIASALPQSDKLNPAYSTLTKRGAGTVEMNASMDKYYGYFNIEEGTFNINRDWNNRTALTKVSGGSLNVNGALVLDNLKKDNTDYFQSGKLEVAGGTVTADSVELKNTARATSADDMVSLTVTSGQLTTGDFTVNAGNVHINGGALVMNGALTGSEKSILLAGGTLQTKSSNVFTGVSDGKVLFANSETADNFVTSDTKLGTNAALMLTSGTVALTDEGYYTNDSLAAMSTALNGQATLTILNAQALLQEGETSMALVEGVVHNEVAGTEGTVSADTADTATATLTTTSAGGTALEVSYTAAGDTTTPTTTASLTAQNASTLILAGDTENSALVTLKSDAEGAQPVAAESVVVGNNVTLQLGNNANPNETQGTIGDITVNGGNVTVTNINVAAGDLAVENGNVTIGTREKRGALSVNALSVAAGQNVFLDPAWSGDAALDTVANASHLAVSEITALNGNLIAGQNSLVAVGSTADEAVAGFNALTAANSGLGWGESNVTAALYVAKPISFAAGSTGKIVVDGNLTALPTDLANYADNVNIAEFGMLMIDQAAIGSETAAINGTLSLADGSYVGLVNANEGTIKLANTVNIAQGDVVDVVTDNPFITAALSQDGNSVAASLDAANGLGALASTGLQAMTRRADSVLAGTIADRTSIDQELNAGINLWVDVRGENYQADNFDNGGEFDADMGYGTFGGDMAFGAFTAGAAFQYGTGSLRSSVSSIKNSIDNYAFSLYGTYKVTDAFKLAAELAYVWGENDISSSQAALNQSVDTEMYSFGLRAMYELKAGNFSFVPSIGLRVSQLSTDAFQVGSVKVEDQDQTLVQVPIALRINASEFDASGWSVAPSFKIAYVPTFGDKDIEVLNHTQDVIDTAPVQADFGLRIGKDNMMFNVNMLLGAGEYGTSAIGGKVGFKYAF